MRGAHGNTPIGVPGGYDSLNLALTTDAPVTGTNVEDGAVFQDTSFGGFQCAGGDESLDTFRRDGDCWIGFTPLVLVTTDDDDDRDSDIDSD